MLCKWCGGEVSNSAAKCMRCGKEIPAISDCGGFYDLVPQAKRPAEAGHAQPVPAQANPLREEPAKQPPRQPDVKQKGGRKGLPILLACIAVAAVAVFLLNRTGLFSGDSEGMEQDDGSDLPIFDQMDPTDESTVDPVEILLEEQDIRLEIHIEDEDDAVAVKTTADLGDSEDEVTDRVTFDKETGCVSAVRLDLGDREGCVGIEMKNTLGKIFKRKESISVEIDVEESVFAETEDEAEYLWEYRIAGSEVWEPLNEDVFTVSKDGTTVTCSADDLEELLEEAEKIEFRLTYKRVNTKGGSLTLVISGLTAVR